jgi:hypothetical protein
MYQRIMIFFLFFFPQIIIANNEFLLKDLFDNNNIETIEAALAFEDDLNDPAQYQLLVEYAQTTTNIEEFKQLLEQHKQQIEIFIDFSYKLCNYYAPIFFVMSLGTLILAQHIVYRLYVKSQMDAYENARKAWLCYAMPANTAEISGNFRNYLEKNKYESVVTNRVAFYDQFSDLCSWLFGLLTGLNVYLGLRQGHLIDAALQVLQHIDELENILDRRIS